ncbi:MAG: hypothetical protein AMXMBFR52_01880 [Burkholderiales bacterium]|jgi:hypothetical protein|nr:hypothetical protein [Burkholderiaceae bacterium]
MLRSGPATYPPIKIESRTHVPTDCAPYHLLRALQALRIWACTDDGPIRPVRSHGRLAWRTADIRRLLDGGGDASR